MKEVIVSLAKGAYNTPYGNFDTRIRRAPKTALPEGTEQADEERVNTIKAVFKNFRDKALEKLREEYPILEEQREAVELFQERLDEPTRLRKPEDLEKRREYELNVKKAKFPVEQYKEQQVPSKLEELMLPLGRN